MNENNTHPLTEDRAAELWDEHVPLQLSFQGWTRGDRRGILDALRAAYNVGRAEWKANAEAAAERAERAEDRLADSVHVDEAARRVEAAREEGWDQATRWIDSYQGGPNGRTDSARSANPYRPAQELPPERDGVVLVPADGHKAITTTKGQEFARLTFTTKQDLWYGPNLAAQPGDWVIQTTTADRLTPDTWRTV